MVPADILPCEETVAKVRAAGGVALAVMVDVANDPSTQAMATQTLQHWGRIDILVNCGAI